MVDVADMKLSGRELVACFEFATEGCTIACCNLVLTTGSGTVLISFDFIGCGMVVAWMESAILGGSTV